jgi:ABC-2 type transport system permease protein
MPGFPALYWRMHRTSANVLHDALKVHPLRGATVASVVSGVWLLLAGLFWSLLVFLSQEQYLPLKPRLLESLLALFFLTMGVLVTISDTVLVWATLYRTRSASFHAALPLTDRAVFWGAALEGGLWASWAVLVLVLPLIGTLVREAAQPLLFAPAALATLLCLVALGMAAGALGAQALARLIPLLRRGLKGIILICCGALAIGLFLALGSAERHKEPVTFMTEVIGSLRFAENPFLPSWWAQQAFSGALASRWNDWLWFTGLLAANAAGVAVVAEFVAARRYRRDLDALSGRPDDTTSRNATRPWRPLRIPFLPPELPLLVAKDLRLFLRDPAQVLQFTAFFGLLGFYLLMLPRLGKAFAFDEWWRPAVSVLNLTAIGMALATFTGRFVYPLLSLEGRRLWVLALAPWPRERVVTGKFFFAILVGLPVSAGLATLSGVMLDLPWPTILYQVAIICCMAVGLAASALGIGARLADYREDDPNKLVAGYGGTINLLASLVFAGLLLLGAAAPIVGRSATEAWIFGGLWCLVVSAIWTVLFLRLSRRWFGRLEDRPSSGAPA